MQKAMKAAVVRASGKPLTIEEVLDLLESTMGSSSHARKAESQDQEQTMKREAQFERERQAHVRATCRVAKSSERQPFGREYPSTHP